MQFAETKWRNRFVLWITWSVFALLILILTTLFFRQIHFFENGDSIPSYTKNLDGMDRSIKLVLLIFASGYWVILSFGIFRYFRNDSTQIPRITKLQIQVLRFLVMMIFVGFSLLEAIFMQQFSQVTMLILAILVFYLLNYRHQILALSLNPSAKFSFQSWENKFGQTSFYWGGIGFITLIMSIIILLSEMKVQPDSYAYLQIAKRYAEGSFIIRGVWSPLLSWLYAPFIALGWEAIEAAKIAHMLIAIGIVLVSRYLAISLKLSPLGQIFVIGGTAGLAVLSARLVNADIVGALFVILLWAISLDEQLLARPIKQGILMGIAGGFAYLGKAYNLPASIVYIILWGLLLSVHGQRVRHLFITSSVAVIVMLIIALPWVIALESRYDEIMLTGSTHLPIRGPESVGLFLCSDGARLCDEPNDILFPWEDHLFKYQEPSAWGTFDSLDTFTYKIVMVAFHILYFFLYLSTFRLPLLFLVMMIFLLWKQKKARLQYSWLFFVCLNYSAGYFVNPVLQKRYFYPVILVLVVGSVLLLKDVIFLYKEINQSNRALHRGLLGFAFIFVIILPYNAFLYTPPSSSDQKSYCIELADEASKLNAPIASIEEASFYNMVQEISYYTEKRTYSSLDPKRHELSSIIAQFNEYQIRSVLVQDKTVAEQLISDYDYEQTGSISSEGCEIDMVILERFE